MKSARVWVLGSRGRLGAAMMRKWEGMCELRGFSHKECDLTDEARLRGVLEGGEFDWIVNCAAMTNVDACESEQELATQTNVTAAAIIAEICAAKSARMIHISTDYVFEGTKTEPYTETDEARPLGVYGQTKLEGERRVLAASERHIVARVSWLFGPDKPSFVDAIIQRALTEEHVEAIDDKISCPSFSEDIADWMWKLMERNAGGGMYHACNSGSCTWREYGEYAVVCAANAGAPVKTRMVGGIPLASMKSFVAKRPVYTVMDNSKIAEAIGEAPRSWQAAVEDFVGEKFKK